MIPPVEIEDSSDYRRKMNELLKVDAASTVVLTVDMQRDYLDMTCGTALVAPEESKRVIYYAEQLLEFSRKLGIPVIHCYVQRRPEEVARTRLKPFNEITPDAAMSQEAKAKAESRKSPSRVAGTPQAEVPATLVAPGDLHLTGKRVMDAFFGTELEGLLARIFRTKTVVITGINTDTCVYGTTFGASVRGYQPIVISDCVASTRGVDQHWMALETMGRSIAWVMTVDEFKSKLTSVSRDYVRRLHSWEARLRSDAFR